MNSFWDHLATGSVFSAGGALVYGLANTIFTHLRNRRIDRATVAVSDVDVIAKHIENNANLTKQLGEAWQENSRLINADSKSARAIGEYRRDLNEARLEIKDLKKQLGRTLAALENNTAVASLLIDTMQQVIDDKTDKATLNTTLSRARKTLNGHTT